MAKMHQEVKQEIKIQKAEGPREQIFPPTSHIAKDLGDTAMYNACPVCSGIFEEEEQVVKCGNPMCNAVYHRGCFQQIAAARCKLCNSKFQ